MSSSPGRRSHSMTGNATQQEPTFVTFPGTGARMSTLSEAAKSSKRSASRKGKKRKPSSQKPPVITPSDASEDDKEPSKIHAVAAASSMSHCAKRFAPNSSRRPCELLGTKNQVVKKKSAHGPKTRHCENPRSSQPPSVPRNLRSDNFVPNKGRRDATLSFYRKRNDKRFLNVTTRRSQGGFHFRRLQKIKSFSSLPTRANKRPRLSSMRTLDSGLGEASGSTRNSRGKFLQDSIITGPLVFGLPSTQKNLHVKAKAQRKRTRAEFETGSHENASVNFCEILGPDIRALRPLPQKVRSEPLALGEDTPVRGVPCGTPSIEHVDQLLRDVASNALAILQDGVGLDVPDWTQNKEQDPAGDDFDGHNEDEVHDVQVTTATSSPPMVIAKPSLPAPPRVWAQASRFILLVN